MAAEVTVCAPKGAEMRHLANQCNHGFKGKTRNARLLKPGSMQLEQRVLIQPALYRAPNYKRRNIASCGRYFFSMRRNSPLH